MSPETRIRRCKRNADARLPLHALPDVSYATFQFGLRAHVCEKKALSAHDDGFERQQAAFVVRVQRFGFFVERLLIGVGAVDEERGLMRVPQIAAAICFVRAADVRAGRLRVAPIRARPLAFGLFQRFPDTAQRNLPSERDEC